MGYNASIGDSYYSFGPDIPKDRVTLGVPVITTDHSLIHEGIAFNVSGTFAEGTGLAVIGIKPPAAAKASLFGANRVKSACGSIRVPTKSALTTASVRIEKSLLKYAG